MREAQPDPSSLRSGLSLPRMMGVVVDNSVVGLLDRRSQAVRPQINSEQLRVATFHYSFVAGRQESTNTTPSPLFEYINSIVPQSTDPSYFCIGVTATSPSA